MKQSLGSVAYQKIYRKIITLEYEPGEHLEESRLVRELDIGRTPIREALMTLCGDLLVESQPGKGFVVRPITLQNTKAAFDALEVMEQGIAPLVIRGQNDKCLLAMRRANEAMKEAVREMNILSMVELNHSFHLDFATCSRNLYLTEALQKVRCETNRLAYLSYSTEIEPRQALQHHYDSVVHQHEEIINAITTRDLPQLQQVLRDHCAIFKNRIISYLTG
ncbi:GntR family transcriptional regulator [Desulfolithobacter dissulfuricans]|nr:GntR family transcriptional regulator [Desulfolithobacter dissulfuricans]